MASENDSQVGETAMHLPSLSSPRSRREVLNVVDAYSHFWKQPKFSTNLAAPPFQPEYITDLLHRAATIVVHIRRHLDREDPEPKVRISEGSANEFLWSVKYDPRKEPGRFVRDLVHATFKDSAGYVEDLTEACIDEYIAEIEEHCRTAPQHQEWWAGGAACGVEQAKPLAEQVMEQLNRIVGAQGEAAVADQARWQSICSALESVTKQLGTIITEIEGASSSPEPKSPVTPATPFAARLARKKNKRQRRKQKQREAAVEAKDADKNGLQVTPTESTAVATKPSNTTEEHLSTAPPVTSPAPEPQPQASDKPDEPTEPAAVAELNENSESVPVEVPEVAVVTPSETEKQKIPEDPETTVQTTEVVNRTETPQQETTADSKEEAPKEESNQTVVELTPPPSPVSDTFRITIGKLHEDVVKRREDVQGLLEASQSLAPGDPNLTSQMLEKLQKRCLESSEYLMRDMLALDGLLASTPEEKAKRKEQIIAIQDLLDSVDVVSEKLRALARKVEEQKAEIKKDKEEALAKAQEEANQLARCTSDAHHTDDQEVFEQKQKEWVDQKSRLQQQKDESTKKLREKMEYIAGLLLEEDAWKSLKMKPRFEVSEQSSTYILKSYIPGMRNQDISVDVNEDGSELIIKGIRIPGRQQIIEMLEQLTLALQQGRIDSQQLLALSDEQLLLLVGSGRYGTFVERFALPDDAQIEGIQAEYERGVLKVYIPKRLMSYNRLFPPQVQYGSPLTALHHPFGGYGRPQVPRAPASFDSLFW